MLAGASSSVCVRASSPIHVVPTIATSGAWLPATLVRILSCAASTGIYVTLTFTPGFSASNSFVSLPRISPSLPHAQTLIVPVAFPPAIGVEPPPRRAAAGGDDEGQRGRARRGRGTDHWTTSLVVSGALGSRSSRG